MTVESRSDRRAITMRRQRVDRLLTTFADASIIATGPQEPSDSMVDPKFILRRLSLRNDKPDQQPLAAALLALRHAFAHWEPLDDVGVRWSFETAWRLLAEMGDTAAASGVLRKQREFFPDRREHGTVETPAKGPRDEDKIRDALQQVLSGPLREVIAARPPRKHEDGIEWPPNTETVVPKSSPEDSRASHGGAVVMNTPACDDLVGILADIKLLEGHRKNPPVPFHKLRWDPFASKIVAATVQACCRELQVLSVRGKVIRGGLDRELSTTRRLLAMMNRPESAEVVGLLNELWQGRTKRRSYGAPQPPVAFACATDKHKKAWDAITDAATRHRAAIFEIIATKRQGRSEFLGELHAHLLEQRFLVFNIRSGMGPLGFIKSLESQLKNSPVLADAYASKAAEWLRSDRYDPECLRRAAFEIDVLAQDHSVAFLFDAPKSRLVDSLHKLLPYLPTALIVYAHDTSQRDLDPQVRVERFELRDMTKDENLALIRRKLGSDAAAPTPGVDLHPAVIECLAEIYAADHNFAIDKLNKNDAVQAIRRFVDGEAKRIVGGSGSPSVFDCLAVMARIRGPKVLIAVLGAIGDVTGYNPDAVDGLLNRLKQFKFIGPEDEDGGVALDSCIAGSARSTVDGDRAASIHRAAMQYFGACVDEYAAFDTNTPWTHWGRIEDPVLRADIHDWLVQIREVGAVPDAVRLRLIRLFLDALWWIEADAPTEFSKNLLKDYRSLGDDGLGWLGPLELLHKSYARLASAAPNSVDTWAEVVRAYDELGRAVGKLSAKLSADASCAREQHRVNILIKLLKADATWGGHTHDDEEKKAELALDLYKEASREAIRDMSQTGEWMALWADLYRLQIYAEQNPSLARKRIRAVESRANALKENEIRIELARLYGDLAWTRKDPESALNYYGRAVLLAYIYQVFQERVMAPSDYTRSLYDSVVEHTEERLGEADKHVADAARDRYLSLFAPFWSQVYSGRECPVGRDDRVFPPRPSHSELYSMHSAYVGQVQDMKAARAPVLAEPLDAPIDCPDPVVVRPAVANDAEQVVKLGNEMLPAGRDLPYRKWGKSAVAAVLSHGENTSCVAEANGKLVGFALTSLTPAGTSGRLEVLVTHTDYHCRGVTYRLVEAVRKQMRAVGRTRLITDVFSDEMAAEMGFEGLTTYTGVL